MKRILNVGLVIILAISIMFTTGCNKEKANDIEEKDTLIIGLDDTFAPMGFRDKDGNLIGFDIDFANTLGEELGMKIEFKTIDWDAKVMELEAGTVDCVWNGMSITPDRIEDMELSNKYLNNKIVLMSLTNGNIDVKDSKELKNLKIGTQVDSSALKMLKQNKDYDSFKDNISEYDTYDVAIMDLKAGRVDVIAVDQVLGEYTNKNLGGEMKENTFNLGDDFYVIGFAKGNTELRDKVNDGMKRMFENGKAEEISNKWFGKNIVVCEPIK